MTGFGSLMASALRDENGVAIDLPDGWTQGRTAYGGLSAALCVETARRVFPDLPPLRSAMFTFAGPASGRLRARASLLRRGRSAAVVEAGVDGETGIASRGFLTYGSARDSAIRHNRLAAPPVPVPDQCDAFVPHAAGPTFFWNFDLRIAGGALPLSGATRPELLFWGRHRDAAGADPLTALVAIADSLPSAAITQFPKFAPISTMTWAFDVFNPSDPVGWHLLHSESVGADNGYSSQKMSVWDESGNLLVSGQQLVAVFA